MKSHRFPSRSPSAVFAAIALAACTSVSGGGDAGAGRAPSPPPPPQSGFGSEATPYANVAWSSFVNPAATGHNVYVAVPEAAAGSPPVTGPLPVVAFLHGFLSSDPDVYRLWIEHEARSGTIVVYPSYPAFTVPSDANRYDGMWVGFEEAVKRLETGDLKAGDGVKPDLERLGIVGHSYGGGAAPSIAARAVARGWGARALWIEAFAPFYDLDERSWASLPAHACLLAVGFDEDETVSPAIATSFLEKATTIPPARKTALVVRSDAHGSPALHATHGTPTSRRTDALDTRAVWRLDDALRAFALTGAPEARASVLSTGPETTGMGTWSDGVPVTPLSVGLPPADGRPGIGPVPRLRWPLSGAVARWMRRVWGGDAWSRRPIPAPQEANPRALPPTERFVAEPPTAPWPEAIAATLGKGPVLVVLSRGDPSATLGRTPALADEEATFAAKGVRVLRLAAGDLGAAGGRVPWGIDWTALLLASDGSPLLWRDASEPNLPAVVLALAAR